jgi:hypothetical protein
MHNLKTETKKTVPFKLASKELKSKFNERNDIEHCKRLLKEILKT